VPGYEGAGVVEDANGVEGWAPGTRVHIFCDPSTGQGSWQQLLCARPEALSRVPEGMPDDVAAQCRGNPATALGILEELAPPAGTWLLHTAAASTLGRMLTALARARGVRTIAVIRSRAGREHQVKALQDLGADAVLFADADDIAARVRELTGGALAWGAADAVGGELTARVMAGGRDGGDVLLYGALAGRTYTGGGADTLGRYVTVKGFMLMTWLQALPEARKALLMQQLDAALTDGTVAPAVAARMPLAEARKGVAASLAPGHAGKVLLMG
jgi:NADPH:quinone reductase-like Zn-dependent oxidoreductase